MIVRNNWDPSWKQVPKDPGQTLKSGCDWDLRNFIPHSKNWGSGWGSSGSSSGSLLRRLLDSAQKNSTRIWETPWSQGPSASVCTQAVQLLGTQYCEVPCPATLKDTARFLVWGVQFMVPYKQTTKTLNIYIVIYSMIKVKSHHKCNVRQGLKLMLVFKPKTQAYISIQKYGIFKSLLKTKISYSDKLWLATVLGRLFVCVCVRQFKLRRQKTRKLETATERCRGSVTQQKPKPKPKPEERTCRLVLLQSFGTTIKALSPIVWFLLCSRKHDAAYSST